MRITHYENLCWLIVASIYCHFDAKLTTNRLQYGTPTNQHICREEDEGCTPREHIRLQLTGQQHPSNAAYYDPVAYSV